MRHAGQLVGANFDGRQEISEARPLLGHRIRGDARHLALDDRSRPLLISHKTNRGRQIRSHHVDIDRLNLHLKHELVAAGNEVEHVASGRDHTPRGVSAKIHDHAVLRRGHYVALGLGPRLGLLLAQGRQPIFVRFDVALHFEHGSLKLKDLRLLCITLLEEASLVRELFLETWKLLLDGRRLGLERTDLPANGIEIGFGVGVVQPHQWLPLHHRIAVMNQNLADDAALKMLHGLAVAVDLHHAWCNCGAGQRCKRGPKTKAAEEDCDHDLASDDILLDRWLGRHLARR